MTLYERLKELGLPERVFIDNSDGRYGAAPVIAIKRGESGYFPIHTGAKAADLNDDGVTPQQISAMLNGSMFGWDAPAADPSNPINKVSA